MLKGKSLMSTAQYYELKRVCEGRPQTPKKQMSCQLGALPRVGPITKNLEKSLFCLQGPLTLLPLTGKRNAFRIPSDKTREMPEQGLQVCLEKVDDKVLTMSAAEIPSLNSSLEIEKTKSASGRLPSSIQENSIPMQRERHEEFDCPHKRRKSRSKDLRRKQSSRWESSDRLSTDSVHLRKTTGVSSGLTCKPEVREAYHTLNKCN